MNRGQRGRMNRRDSENQRGSLLEQAALGMCAALLVLSTVVPSEGAVRGSGALLATAWMVQLVLVHLVIWQQGARPRFSLVDGLVLLLAGWLLVSTLVMAWQGNPRQTLNAAWQWASLLAGYWSTRQLLVTGSRMRMAVAIFMSTAAALSAHGLYQFTVGMPHTVARYERATEAEKQQMLLESGVDVQAQSPLRVHFENRLKSTEPYATFGLANSLAGFLATWLIVLIAWQLEPAARVNRWPRAALLPLSLAILACLVLTKSRAAWIAFSLGCLGLLVVQWRFFFRQRLVLPVVVIALAAVIGIAIVGGALDRQVLTEARLSVAYRLQYWQAALHMAADHPWFGCGPGNFQEYYSQYKLPMASETVADPHNGLFEVAATLGVPAAVLVSLLLVVWTRGLFGRKLETSSEGQPHDEPTAVMCVGAAFGGLLAIVYGWLMNLPVETDPWLGFPILLWLDLPVAAITLWIIRCSGFLNAGSRFAVAPLALAAMVMSVNLTAAGGISYLGVGLSLWVLVALTVNRLASGASIPYRSYAAVGLVVSGCLLATCWLTEYKPVLSSSALMDRAAVAMRQTDDLSALQGARQAALLAADADPWSPQPWELLSQIELQRWVWDRVNSKQEFERAVQEARRRNRRSQSLEMTIAAQYLAAFQRGGNDDALPKSLAALRRAAQRYPNSNYIHAQLAWVAHLGGNPALAGKHAVRALELDRANPHWEQQLKQRRIQDFGGPRAANEPLPDELNAEQVAIWLRNRYYSGRRD